MGTPGRARGPSRRRTRRRIGFEGLERRELLSAVPMASEDLGRTAPVPPAPVVQAAFAPRALPFHHLGRVPPQQQMARPFIALFRGSVVTGPGRFADERVQSLILGAGNSSAFLHGHLVMAVQVPVDPEAPIQGTASLNDKNLPDTNNFLRIALEGPVDPASDGRPTLLNWTAIEGDGGFWGAEGSGTVEIRYFHHPGDRLPPRASAAGRVAVIIRGELRTLGTGTIVYFE